MKTLLNEEYNVLNKIANKTKADCWFFVEQDESEVDYIFDLEENKALTLFEGVSMLMECIDCKENYENCNLSDEEKEILKNILTKLNIEFYN